MISPIDHYHLSTHIRQLELLYADWNPKPWLQMQKRKAINMITEKAIEAHFIRVPPSKIRYTFDAKSTLVARLWKQKTIPELVEIYHSGRDQLFEERTEALLTKLEGMVYAHVKHLGGKVHEFKWMESPGIGKHGFEFRANIPIAWRDLEILQLNMSHACRVTNKHYVSPRIYVEKQRIFTKV
ncbi:uncharacterized protein LOC62_06G007853 [Vanrija pseudolonga]|uniref:Uncharacterized protein n=1 Tax=Vanrija pseudolonga TaxID=143232 RepID=A0AAF0YCR1_9TREE|nr:hypothetical protein LOC62_06G007853 [Vanrija pseudolonga]